MTSPATLVADLEHPFALGIGTALELPLVQYSTTTFLSGETDLVWHHDTTTINNKPVILFYLFSQEQPHHHTMILIQIIEKLIEFHAHNIHLVIPYLPYGREKNEQGYHRIARLLHNAGATTLDTIECHTTAWMSDYPWITHHDLDDLWEHVIEHPIHHHAINPQNMIIMSPDSGGKARTQRLALRMHCTAGFCVKQRDRHAHITIHNITPSVKDHHVILIDDMIDSAATAYHASIELLNRGAQSVIGLFSHPILSAPARQRIALLRDRGVTLYAADTVIIDNNAPKLLEIISTYEKLLEICNVICHRYIQGFGHAENQSTDV